MEGTAEDDSGGYGQDKSRTKRVTCDNEDSFAATGTTQVTDTGTLSSCGWISFRHLCGFVFSYK